MRRNLIASLLLLSLPALSSFAPAATEGTCPTGPVTQAALAEKPESPVATTIQWLSIEEAAEKMKQEPRKLVIDVYTDWCGWCKKMDKETFTDPKVVALVNEHYYAVKLDAEGKKPITLNGHTFEFKPEYKAHELAVALLNGQMSFPTTVYLDEKMNMLTPVPGYLDAAKFSQVLRYFGENHHKAMSWQEFEQKK
ncbi:thioredoxin-related protein [Pontibacter ummariensis]|uniref:Thioredoxin-related protein n=1 Tax=Pontibacter ummariensis TaxID=1610492 RepID=A0A239FVW8_9BACT|nr:thioredoxin fold domain-containing protein [Pontibacter ummariensis]PRY11912.1 thioredoxin-related protein [Pontibacter ummariensis]SNS60678.1 Thioredoxin-related protein [Pontibacter ummariensis]